MQSYSIANHNDSKLNSQIPIRRTNLHDSSKQTKREDQNIGGYPYYLLLIKTISINYFLDISFGFTSNCAYLHLNIDEVSSNEKPHISFANHLEEAFQSNMNVSNQGFLTFSRNQFHSILHIEKVIQTSVSMVTMGP